MVSHDGQVALVTGGSRGIGRAVARELVASGACVMVTGRKEPALRETAAELGDACAWRVCHVADEPAARECVAATVGTFGGLDLLVNNAAVNPQWGPTLEVDAGIAAKLAEVNLWAPLLWSGLAWDAGLRERGGAIVNVSSLGALIAAPHTGYYNATKAGLTHLTRQLAAELAPRVRVNAVAPGLIMTEMAGKIPDNQRRELLAGVPLGRLGAADDIAAAVSFLLSDRAAWMTGSVLVVDGGASLGRGASA